MSTNPLTIIQTAEIPPIPAVLQQILAMADNPNTTSAQLEKLVSQEPALVAQLLKWVNSAYYSLPKRVSSISHAMILLGFSTVKSIASGLMLINAFEDMELQDRNFVHQVWQHTLLTANFTKILAQREPISKQDDFFLAGMIHDVGYIVLREYFGKKYQTLIAKNPFPTPQEEDALLGVNHTVIGTALLKEWHFPEEVTELVRCQHAPDNYMGQKREIAFLTASDNLANQKNLRHFFLKEEHQVDKEELKIIQLTGWDWPRLKASKQKFLDASDMTQKLFAQM